MGMFSMEDEVLAEHQLARSDFHLLGICLHECDLRLLRLLVLMPEVSAFLALREVDALHLVRNSLP